MRHASNMMSMRKSIPHASNMMSMRKLIPHGVREEEGT
jgi:hypothetical protein